MGRLQKSYSTCMECGGKTKMKSGGNWIKGAIKNPGSFTKQAQSAGMSVPAFRDKVLANKGDYSGTTVKRASLAKTLSGMKKGQSGMLMEEPLTASISPTTQIRRPKATSSNLPAIDMKVKAIDPDLKQGKQMIGDLERQAERDNVRRYQQMLNTKYGLNLDVDGAWGKDTQAAYEKYVLKKSSSPSTAKKANTPSTYNPSRYPAKSTSSEVKTDPNTPWKNRPVQMSRTPEINPFTDRRPTSFADYLNSVNMNAGKKPATKVSSAKREGYAGYLDSVNTNRRMKSGGVKLKNYLK